MKTIKALRQFSHYHEGNFSEGDVREVPDDVATALVDMGLAEEAGAGDADRVEGHQLPRRAVRTPENWPSIALAANW